MTTDHFKQIKPGPRPPDEPNGASDILAFYNLRRLHDLTQSGTFVAQQQEQARRSQLAQGGGSGGVGVPGDARLWKRGAATGLAPLASKPAPSVPAGSRPALAVAPLTRSLAILERGAWSLRDGERGELVAEGTGEESAAAVLLPAAATAAGSGRKEGATTAAAAAAQQALTPSAPSPAGAGAAGTAPPAVSPARPKIKLKVKFGGKKN